MKKYYSFAFLLILFTGLLFAQEPVQFDDYFLNKTMRIDYFHLGDAQSEGITLDHVYQQGEWAGSTTHLIDNFNNGRYYVKIYDVATKKLIYSRGYDSYFGEYKTSTPAINGVKRTFHESALIPYPKNKILFTVEFRNRQNHLLPLFRTEIDPDGVDIIKESLSKNVKVIEVVKNGDPHQKVDIAFIAEGYTADQEGKFREDLKKIEKIFFDQEPYKSYRDRFNLYGVFKASDESGVDEPRAGIFKNTAVSASFNSLGSARYLLTEDNKALRDIAAHAPYDALVIVVNHSRYGGGGIYNLFCTFTIDNQWHSYLLLHEFGHSFGGLADEYYSSSVAYNDFYPKDVEPTEPNITTLLDPANLKWKDLLTPGTEIPTPWNKKKFDKMNAEYQKTRQELNDQIAKLKKEGGDPAEIKKLEEKAAELSRRHAQQVDDFIKHSKYYGKVGAFEGAGYSSEGIYRPMLDCIMFSKGKKPYCKVCENAIIKVIKHFSE